MENQLVDNMEIYEDKCSSEVYTSILKISSEVYKDKLGCALSHLIMYLLLHISKRIEYLCTFNYDAILQSVIVRPVPLQT